MKKKGFSMIELLSVVVIIGVVATIGIVGVTKLVKSSHMKYNDSQLKLFIAAGQNYFTDHKSKLPTLTGTYQKVTLEKLINENYIDQLLDDKKQPYSKNKSYVKVIRLGTELYAYNGKLLSDKSKVEQEVEKGNATIIFQHTKNEFDKTQKKYTNKDSTVQVTIQDPEKIASYRYMIYYNGKNKYTSEWREVLKNNSKFSINLNVKDNFDGQYYIKVEEYSMEGSKNTNQSGILVLDRIAPTCKVQGTNTKWTNKDITITYGCQDENSGCNTENKTVTIQTTTEKYTLKSYQIVDKAGNKTQCSSQTIPVYVDITPPTCKTVGGNKKWTNQDVTIEGFCEDNESGCKKNSISKKITTETNEELSPGSVFDNVGNEEKCKEVMVKIDKTPPTHKKMCVCKSGQKPKSCSSAYNLKYKIYDRLSGLKDSDWAWNAQGNDSPLSWTDYNSYDGRTSDYYGYICVGIKGGKYTYSIYDQAGNVTKGSEHINHSDKCDDCSSHDK